MAENQIIALIGDTLLIDSIEASLGSRDDLWVVRMSGVADLPVACSLFIPDFIIADLRTVEMCTVLEYLTRYPGVSLLGVEARSDRVVAVNCDHFSVQSAEELTRLIRGAVHPSAARSIPADLIESRAKRFLSRDTVPPQTVH
jgi:hypothetical protein